MKKLLVIAAMMTLSGLSLSAQDTIKLKKGEELRVKVLKVTPSYIEYSYPNEDAIIQIQKKKVASIHYESGRVEEFTPVKQPAIEEGANKVVKAPKSFNSSLAKKQMFYVKAGLALNKVCYYDKYRYELSSGYVPKSVSFKTGEALDLGYSRYINDSKFYWAAELGLTTRGYYYDLEEIKYYSSNNPSDFIIRDDCYQYLIHHGIKFAPVIFGYRFMLPRDFAIDLRLGGYFTYYYTGKMVLPSGSLSEKNLCYTWSAKIDDEGWNPYFKKQRRYNAGLETGIAFWYKRFCFDFTYNVGFVSYFRTLRQPEDMSPEEYLDELYGYTNNLKWEVLRKNYNYNIQFKLGIAI